MKKMICGFALTLAILLFTPITNTYAATDPSTFTPYQGTNKISSDSSGRYASYGLYWRSGGMSEFDSITDTYEHEIVFYNYDGTAYATSATSYQSALPDTY